jgi:hypothetical protein
MTRQHWWIAAALALLVVGGIAIATVLTYVPDSPVPAATPTPAHSEDGTMTGRVTVTGEITEISEPAADGSVLLRRVGVGYLPIIFAEGVRKPGFNATLVLAVPESLAEEAADSSDAAEVFAQLIAFTLAHEEPLVVVEVVRP